MATVLSKADSARFKEAQRASWSEPDLVAAYRRWRPTFASLYEGADQVILEEAKPAPGLRVLDLASGSGDPAFALARAVGPGGHVTATDISPGMVALVGDLAREQGLANITSQYADAEELPFGDESFDLLTCRFGIMFCPDHLRALAEARRVLKPGSRAIYLVWGQPNATVFQVTIGVLRRHVEMPTPPPGAPTPFKFAEPGSLSAALAESGFRDIDERRLVIPVIWPESAARLWQFFVEMGAAVFRELLGGLSPEKRAQVEADIVEATEPYRKGNRIELEGEVVVVSGTR